MNPALGRTEGDMKTQTLRKENSTQLFGLHWDFSGGLAGWSMGRALSAKQRGGGHTGEFCPLAG